MPDGQDSIQRVKTRAALSTSELHAALGAANLLVDHAASMGLFPPGPASNSLIADIVQAHEAEQQNRLSAEIVIAFWSAYARLAILVKPVTAASLRASNRVSLGVMKAAAVVLVFSLIVVSIFLFMSNATASDASDLIDQQNAAALRLWSDMQVLRANAASEGAKPTGSERSILTERIFEELVEFSRKNNALLQSASRLNYWFIPPWLELSPESVRFEPGQPIDHINVSPRLSSSAEIDREGLLQVEAYQAIRNYALALCKMEGLLYGSLSTYLLPVVYALLGAFLYGFRLYSRLIRRKEYLESAAHSARYFIAAIAGLVIGLFGSLLPKNLALPPLAVAFLMGYAVEAFFSRLDVAIAKVKGTAVAPASQPQTDMGAD